MDKACAILALPTNRFQSESADNHYHKVFCRPSLHVDLCTDY